MVQVEHALDRDLVKQVVNADEDLVAALTLLLVIGAEETLVVLHGALLADFLDVRDERRWNPFLNIFGSFVLCHSASTSRHPFCSAPRLLSHMNLIIEYQTQVALGVYHLRCDAFALLNNKGVRVSFET